MTTTLSSENVSLESKSIIVTELLQGHDSASQLKLLLQNPSGGPDGPNSAQQLLAKIIRSFTLTISVLTSLQAADAHVGQNLTISGENGQPVGDSSNDRRPRDSGESRKKSSPASNKDRRGCYKRRKTAHTWTEVSNTVDDNHAWRKYGQKHILNSQFPRSYFRCTRKNEQGCKAIKQVQRIQENPEMFETTYIGIHTCKDMILNAPGELVKDSAGNWESYLVSESKVQNDDDQKVMTMHNGPYTSSSSSPNIKQEYPKEDTPQLSDVTDNLDLWSDLKDIELPHPSINADDHTMDFGVESLGFGTHHPHHHFHY